MPIETFIEVFIKDNLEEETETSTEEKGKSFSETATTEEWLAKFHRWIDSHQDRGEPYSSDEATRREIKHKSAERRRTTRESSRR